MFHRPTCNDGIFHEMSHIFLKDYVDDIVVMSREISQHISDLRKVLLRSMQYNLRINLLKCAFGVSSNKYLRLTVYVKKMTLI